MSVVRQGNSDFSWIQRCVLCGKPGNMRCKRCKGVFYCSADHQKQHWMYGHKACCVAPPPEPSDVYFKSLEAVLDIAAPFFVHGPVFDSVAVATTALQSQAVDGRTVTLLTTSARLGRAVSAAEFCGARPELYYVAQTLNRGLLLALTLVGTLRRLAAAGAAQPGARGSRLQFSYTGERVVEYGVVERAAPQRADYEAFVFVDGATGAPYGSTVASAADHGLVYVRTKPSNRVHLIDFAAAQFGATSLVNGEAPLFVATAGSERAARIYGPDRVLADRSAEGAAPATADWHRVRERDIDAAVARFLEENDNAEHGSPALQKQMELATAALVSYAKAIFDLK